MNPKSLLLIMALIMLGIPSFAISITPSETPEFDGEDSTYVENYIVIGTYGVKNNALNHLKIVKSKNPESGIFFDDKRKMYYVYAYKSNFRQATLNKLKQLKENPYFQNAWVFRDKPAPAKLISNNGTQPKKLISITNPASQRQDSREINPGNAKMNKAAAMQRNENPPVQLVAHNSQTTNQTNTVALKSPAFKSQPPTHTSDLILEPVEVKDDVNDILNAKAGDIIVLKNLIFYRNAAILKPSAEYELKDLLSILKQKPNISITIHGHTNGEFRGDIVRLGKKDRDYFHLSSKNENLTGNAVLLSVERANIVKKYLERNGILSGRINTIGWGGVQPLYPPTTSQAIFNSRIEIEIMSR